METIWGKVQGETAQVYVFHNTEHVGAPAGIYVDHDRQATDDEGVNEELTLLGSIHSHPGGESLPSNHDIKNQRDEGELVMGIMAVRLSKSGRRFCSFLFWNEEPLELVIAEG